ncbi:glycoside hydrolase family 108 protein [Azorhizobium doebereinerae]|uniref:glycoside hydrolase family 108 protein n=1 Tax=Azorhizobium doebereinerae TaxID=281091 RepID=UPI0004180D9A|nr:glycosyl hydrolase 108 family protein [Azorhizobium doebereinerae]
MAASSFDAALARVLQHEGGYSNHPADPGGPTMRGVIQRVYDGYRSARGLPVRPVRQIAARELTDIYRTQYWDAVRADDLPPGLDYVVFDGAVNSGPGQSAKWLQRGLGLVADGQVGTVTLAAARASTDPAALVDAICDRRLAMLRSLATWPVFGAGWARRVEDVRRAGRAWVREGAPAAVAALAPAGAKAPAGSAAPLPRPQAAAGAAAGGAMTSALSEAARQIEPLAGTSRPMALLFAGLTVAGVLVTLGALAWLWRAEQRRARQAAALDLLPAAGEGGA